MDRFPKSLYRHPAAGPGHEQVKLQDGVYDHTTVHDEDAHDAHLADGWGETPAEARDVAFQRQLAANEAAQRALEDAGEKAANISDDNLPATRAELEAKATELAIKFDGRMSDKTLAKKIGEALASNGA